MFRSFKKVSAGIAVLAVLALGASAVAAAASSSTTSSASAAPKPRAAFPAPGTASHEDAEKAVTGDAAAKADAAAVKSLGGGTAGAVTTDLSGHGYEVTVTKSDGTKVEVHLDGSFNVAHGPPGGRCAPPGHGGTAAHGQAPAGGPPPPPPGA